MYRSEIAGMLASSGEPLPNPSPSARVSPSPSPSLPPTLSPSPAPAKRRLIIHGTGDASLDPNYIPNFKIHGYRHAWTGLRGMLRRDDITVISPGNPSDDATTDNPRDGSAAHPARR